MKKAATHAMAFDDAAHLPVVGEVHPMRRRYRRFAYYGTVIAVLFHLVGFGGWYIARNWKKEPERPREIRLVKYTELGVPPSIAAESAPTAVQVAAQVAPPTLGIPEPVPDFQATTSTIATQDQLAQMLVPTSITDFGGGSGDSLIIDIPSGMGNDNPSPDDFVAVEEMPVLIQIPAPVYPEMARQAEVEGTVMVRALVGRDGKVQDAFVTEGVPMLNEAAIAAAKKAVFKPALQQHKPVAVWVQIPMRFSLN